jgi:NDP-sugar pyrophosphorylase family protein
MKRLSRHNEPTRLNGNGHTMLGDGDVYDLLLTGASRPVAPRAIILAGGRGTRLAPFTSVLPKPLMPIGSQAVLEIVVDQLEAAGICHVTLCVGYLAHLIEAVFDRRSTERLTIDYVREEYPLGTAAPLRGVSSLNGSTIVMNGDIITDIDYRRLMAQHTASGAVMTVAALGREARIDYGVIETEAQGEFEVIVGWDEKPTIQATVSMGIYVIEPEVLSYLPTEDAFDIPELILALVSDQRHVGVYRHTGKWFDIGREEDFRQATAFLGTAASADPAASLRAHMPSVGET